MFRSDRELVAPPPPPLPPHPAAPRAAVPRPHRSSCAWGRSRTGMLSRSPPEDEGMATGSLPSSVLSGTLNIVKYHRYSRCACRTLTDPHTRIHTHIYKIIWFSEHRQPSRQCRVPPPKAEPARDSPTLETPGQPRPFQPISPLLLRSALSQRKNKQEIKNPPLCSHLS